MSLSRTELLKLARGGAEARVRELRTQLEALYKSFPDLRRGGRVQKSTGGGKKKSRRRKMSTAARKAVSARMKKYWAAKRAASKK